MASLKSFYKNLGKSFLAASLALCLTGAALAIPAPSAQVSGKINPAVHTPGESGTCSITSFPRSVEEFKKLQAQAAKEPQGAVACFLAAMKLYSDNEKIGEECLKLASWKLGPSELSLLKQKLRGPESDSYVQKYLPMAFFKGADPDNGYTPSQPFTVELSVNSGRPYSRLTEAKAPVIYMMIKTKGSDSGSRPVSVVKPKGSDYYVVFDRGSLFSQVINI